MNYSTTLGEVETPKYQIQVEFNALSRAGDIVKTYKFVNCYPTSVGEISYANDAENIAEFPVTLMYDYFVPLEAGGQTIV